MTSAPVVARGSVTFRLADQYARLRGVRLQQEVRIPGDQLNFRYRQGTWRLRLPRPAVDRMEYLFELRYRNDDRQTMPDPANPRRAPGAFGEKSVIEFPEYRPPRWLDLPRADGDYAELHVQCRALRATISGLLWTPAGLTGPAPLLVAHDGPEYAEYAALTRFLDAMSWEERIPPLRAALIQPVDRNETYSASALYAGALVRELLPEITKCAPHGKRIGMGASLGALAMLHAHARHPKSFDGLLLQSGSFFRQRYDKQESGFPRYRRITRFVGTVLRGVDVERTIPIAITCGTGEENRANNEDVAAALTEQGYPTWLAEVRDGHTWTGWRDSFDPHLPALIEAVS